MSASAYNAQGTTLTIGTVIGAKTITAISKANPAVITSTAHGLSDGDVVKIAAVVGMIEINGKVGVVVGLTANTFALYGVDSTNYTTYTSGGTATGAAYKVSNWKSWSGLDGQGSDIDVTDLDSLAKEYRMGLMDFGQITYNVQVKDDDDGQMALRGSQAASGPASTHVITFKNGKTRTFKAYCKQTPEQGGVDAVIEGSFACKITGTVARGP
jgi:hypothetical protein